MKINNNYWKDNSKSDDKKTDRAEWVAQARRNAVKNDDPTKAKPRPNDAFLKEENKFIGILEAAEKSPKAKPTGENSGEKKRDDEKSDRKKSALEKDSTENAAVNERVERSNSQFGGGSFGGGFGNDFDQTIHLSENFAARSILHIADLERLVSAVRKQTKLAGKREITLEMKRSVLSGLKVKITTGDAAQVGIEFIAANEKIRSQIENHSDELAQILRGRGINLRSLTTTIDGYQAESNAADFNILAEKK